MYIQRADQLKCRISLYVTDKLNVNSVADDANGFWSNKNSIHKRRIFRQNIQKLAISL